MEIRIAHLYYDLMNLYGEQGNANVLSKTLMDQGINIILDKLTIGDNIDFDNYDIYIIGSGTEDNQKIVLKDLFKYKNQIKNSINQGKFFLSTGNSIELFGKTITDINGKIYDGLSIFDYNTTYKERLVSEVLFKCSLIDDYVLGFQNQGGSINDYDFNLFDVYKGIGSYKGSTKEGIHYKNFYSTYVIGPILARNPKFLVSFIKDLIKQKDSNFNFKDFDLELEQEAYDNFIKLYHSN